jgi:hypothetical protein
VRLPIVICIRLVSKRLSFDPLLNITRTFFGCQLIIVLNNKLTPKTSVTYISESSHYADASARLRGAVSADLRGTVRLRRFASARWQTDRDRRLPQRVADLGNRL